MKTLITISLSILFVATTACGSAHPEDRCGALAEVSCFKLQDCLGFEYERCVKDYKRDVCENVEDVSDDFVTCFVDVAVLSCDGTYPPPSCDDALIMSEHVADL